MIAWKHLLPDRGKSRNDTEKFSSVFGTAQKMSQLGDIGYSTLTDFSPFWGPSWDPLKEQICSVNNYVMIVVAGIARAWWDATRLHTPTAFSEQLGAVCGWSRWSPWQVWGYKARDSPLKSEIFRPSRLWGCQDNMSPQASYLWSTDCSVWRTTPSSRLVSHIDFSVITCIKMLSMYILKNV